MSNGKEPKLTVFFVCFVLVVAIAAMEFGFILGMRWKQSFSHEDRLLSHETKIKILQSEMKEVRERMKLP